ncbi:MAG: hypothetical protein ACI97A_004017 [Planctomycetota bacterium]|jgi:hypothetical protein
MNVAITVDYKRLSMIFLPAFLILGVAGFIAVPSLSEITDLRIKSDDAVKTIHQASLIRPLLLEYEASTSRHIKVVGKWIESCIPKTSDPRIFLADCRLAELRSRVGVIYCQEYLDNEPGDVEDENAAKPQEGSTWNIQVEGKYQEIARFISLIQHGERLYVPSSFELWPAEKGGLRAYVSVFVPGLVPQRLEEKSRDQ